MFISMTHQNDSNADLIFEHESFDHESIGDEYSDDDDSILLSPIKLRRPKRLKVDNDPPPAIKPIKEVPPVSIEQILQLQTISKRKDSYRVILDGSSSLFVPKPALIQLGEFFESYFNFQEAIEDDVQSDTSSDEAQSDEESGNQKAMDLSQVISPADCVAMQHLLSIATTSFIFSRPLSELPIPVDMSVSHLVKLLFLADRLQFSPQVYSYLSTILKKKLSDDKGLNAFLQGCYDEFQDQDIPIHQIVAFSESFADVSTSLERKLSKIPKSCRRRLEVTDADGPCQHGKRVTDCYRCFASADCITQLDRYDWCDYCHSKSPFSVHSSLRDVKVFQTLFPALWLSDAYKNKLFVDHFKLKKDVRSSNVPDLVEIVKQHLSKDLRKEIIPFLSMLCAVDVV